MSRRTLSDFVEGPLKPLPSVPVKLDPFLFLGRRLRSFRDRHGVHIAQRGDHFSRCRSFRYIGKRYQAGKLRMSARSRALIAALGFVIAVAALMTALAVSPVYQQCYAEAEKENGNENGNAPNRVKRHIAWQFLRCEAVSLNKNNGAVTAIATLAIAAFTLVLWLATSKQARLTAKTARLVEEQIKLAREEFIASHRPLMAVHAVRLLDLDSARAPHEQPLRAEFRVINAGTSACRVTGSAVYLDILPELDRPYLPELPPNGLVPARRYDVGTTDNVLARTTDIRGADLFFGTDGRPAYLSGWIVYEDNAGSTRTTFFCRQCTDRFKRQFVPIDDPDCERTY